MLSRWKVVELPDDVDDPWCWFCMEAPAVKMIEKGDSGMFACPKHAHTRWFGFLYPKYQP